jgi:hypothetical protein
MRGASEYVHVRLRHPFQELDAARHGHGRVRACPDEQDARARLAEMR